MTRRRIAVTGLGLVSPVGNTVDEAWSSLLAGKSGIGPITRFDVSAFPTRFGGEVRGFEITDYLEPKEARKMDVFIHYGMAAGIQAIRDSGVEVTDANAHRIGVAIGAGIGGLQAIEKAYGSWLENGTPRRISPFFVPSSIINMIAGDLSIMYGMKGPNLALVTACTTATHNIGVAARAIAYGDADVMVAGGSEMATTPTGVGGFCAARALSTRNDDPQRASRPWDRERDGFVLSDGAGIIVLEELEHARKRGANIYCELVGFGMSGDAYHMTSPPEDGAGARLCMQNALNDAGLNPDEVQYVNAHGTSTVAGDRAETRAIKDLFGDHASKLAVSSTKSMTGHLLGAAGGVEAIFSILALRDQVVPPTINLDDPDDGCDLDYVPHTARELALSVTVSNSFGFGGTNGTLVFRQPG
ncbi:MAG: beta-ketoacyl-ACP synthase II [Xanthomonadaceae bacterium]|nr:beta-ketoacyl-ACP synthase II [Xanthomonadaceae bacterium]